MLIAKLLPQLFTKLRPSFFILFIAQINHYRKFAALRKFIFFVSWLALFQVMVGINCHQNQTLLVLFVLNNIREKNNFRVQKISFIFNFWKYGFYAKISLEGIKFFSFQMN